LRSRLAAHGANGKHDRRAGCRQSSDQQLGQAGRVEHSASAFLEGKLIVTSCFAKV
jgi:hypothetical protein